MKIFVFENNFIKFFWVKLGKNRRFFHKMESKAFKGGGVRL
jgi:hypothetical protein